ncbi:MAG TPA: hypothetical protein VGI92_05415 [Gemmatimonadales bacterium]
MNRSRAGAMIAIAAAVAIAIGLFTDPRRTGISLLTMWAAGLGIALGASTLLMIGGVTEARWLAPWVPVLKRVAASVVAFAVLFVPILLVARHLYPWAGGTPLLPQDAEQIRALGGWFSVPAFVVRWVFYFGCWIVLAALLRRDGPASRAISAVGLPVMALTQTFAAFDGLMSLTARWYSTVYGIYYFSGGLLSTLALLAIVAYRSDRGQPAQARIPSSNYRSLGLMLLTFVIFWAYIAFAQFLIIWIADVPREIIWYLPRIRGGWGSLGVVLVLGHFAIPLAVLLSARVKEQSARLAALGVWLLVMHVVDLYWLIEPSASGGAMPHWQDLAALALVAAVTIRSAGPFPPAPGTDRSRQPSAIPPAAGAPDGMALPVR